MTRLFGWTAERIEQHDAPSRHDCARSAEALAPPTVVCRHSTELIRTSL